MYIQRETGNDVNKEQGAVELKTQVILKEIIVTVTK